MKSSKHIISLLKLQKKYEPLRLKDEINRFKAAYLTLALQKRILYIHTKNSTLFFAVTHPSLCQEINYISKGLLQTIKDNAQIFPSLCKLDSIKAYIPRENPRNDKHIAQKNTDKTAYIEYAKGDFINHCEPDSELFNAFERIKLLIKNNQNFNL